MSASAIPTPCALCPLPAPEQVNTLVSEAFVQFFVRIVGHYASHIKWSKNGPGTFQERAFCKAIASKTNRKFVKKFVKTNMFSLFIEDAEKSRIPQEGKWPHLSFRHWSGELCKVLGCLVKRKRCPVPRAGCSTGLGMLRTARGTQEPICLPYLHFSGPVKQSKSHPQAHFRSCLGLRQAYQGLNVQANMPVAAQIFGLHSGSSWELAPSCAASRS